MTSLERKALSGRRKLQKVLTGLAVLFGLAVLYHILRAPSGSSDKQAETELTDQSGTSLEPSPDSSQGSREEVQNERKFQALVSHIRGLDREANWAPPKDAKSWATLLIALARNCTNVQEAPPPDVDVVTSCRDHGTASIVLSVFDLSRESWTHESSACTNSLRRMRGTLSFLMREIKNTQAGKPSRLSTATPEVDRWVQAIGVECGFEVGN